MRINEPVTQREYEIREDATLMSTTDTQSHIAYANAAFIEVSGFTQEELSGQPHNIVRHPDMPAEAFADMWSTLKNGEPWTALVKNRRRDGDHYWVRANAVPVVRNGKPVGYLSVRTKPKREEIDQAETLYREMREGRSTTSRLHKGLILRKGPWGWMWNWRQTMRVRWRIRCAFIGGLLLTASSLLMLDVTHAQGFILLAAMTLASLLGSWFLESQVARPLEVLREQALKVSTGASHSVTPLNRCDEIGMGLRAVGQLGLMFRWLIDDVAEQVLSVQHAVSEIAQGNLDRGGPTYLNTIS